MCGRFVLDLAPEVLHEWFETVGAVDFPPRYNIAPTQPVLVVLHREAGREAEHMRWGLVPNWVKDPQDFPLIINARVETLRDKPAFRGSLRHHRCIVPASGYYEWRKGPGGKKQPHYITRADGQPMALAGVYATWEGPNGEVIDTAAIVTVPANGDVAHIHERMPATIAEDAMADWLDVRGIGEKEAFKLLRPSPEGTLAAHAVSTRVNAVKNDDAALVAEVAEDAPEPPKAAGGGQLDLF